MLYIIDIAKGQYSDTRTHTEKFEFLKIAWHFIVGSNLATIFSMSYVLKMSCYLTFIAVLNIVVERKVHLLNVAYNICHVIIDIAKGQYSDARTHTEKFEFLNT